MAEARDPAYLESLVRELAKLPAETPWVEFKANNTDPQMIGERISALANSTALEGKAEAYLVWGVKDGTQAIIGTSFEPATATKGTRNLESWLVQMLSPRLNIRFDTVVVNGHRVVLLQIPRSSERPTAFSGIEYIRIGPTTTKLKDHPQKEAELWRIFDRTPFEEQLAAMNLVGPDVLAVLDYPSYFKLLSLPLPTEQSSILAKLEEDRLVRRNDAGRFDITNLGAILFATDLQRFPTLARKAVRLIVYDGRSRVKTVRELVQELGYAAGFERLMTFLDALLPRNEIIGKALRRDVPMFPDLAVRELIANSLIHQDFALTGTGPMVEVFKDRIEVTNPGASLIDVARLLDHAPRSRNEALASFMRRIKVCEERGSGVDKVVFETEFYQLPPPRWERQDGAFRVVLFAHKTLRDMDRSDRVHACYLHACLRHVMRDPMTNTTLRQRFGIEPQNAATASRIIRDALQDRLIKPYEEGQSKKTSRYLPIWA
jgi:predicted HTH transcriptional regulator